MPRTRLSRTRCPFLVLDSHTDSAPAFLCEDERNAISSDTAPAANAPFLCRLAAIAHSSNDAIVSESLSGVIQTWNEGAERIYGYKASEVIGKPTSILFPQDGCITRTTILDAVRSGQEVKDFETIRVKSNGDRITVKVTVSPIRNTSGRIVSVVSVARDTSDCKRTEESLRASERQFRLLFHSNPVPMWVFDRNTLRFLAVNEAAVRQYGYSEPEFLTMSIKDIRPLEDVPHLLEDLALKRSGLQEPGFWKHRRKDGNVIDVQVVAHDLSYLGQEGELVAAYDVTDTLRSQRLLSESEAKYRVLFEESPDAHWLLNQSGFVDCNAAALRMFGFEHAGEFRHPADISPSHQPDGTPLA